MIKPLVILSFSLSFSLVYANNPLPINRLSNDVYRVNWPDHNIEAFTYQLKNGGNAIKIQLPAFEINGHQTKAILNTLKQVTAAVKLNNGVTEYKFEGAFKYIPALMLDVSFQLSPDNAVLRFKYALKGTSALKLTKTAGKDNISYLNFNCPEAALKEVRFSEFNERFHATHLTQQQLDGRYFKDSFAFMGPLAVFKQRKGTFLLAYEHGSQYPDRFFEYQLHPDRQVELRAVKGNYLNGQPVSDFESVWFDVAGVNADEDALAYQFRDYVLRYMSQNKVSREPVISYNTWGRQERVYWRGGKYLSSMNLETTLKDIDAAHKLGIEVYVIDMGWFARAGDWTVNKKLFPDDLKQVRAKLDTYGMRLGLWFDPTYAAVTSDMYKRNPNARMGHYGKLLPAAPVWETETSYKMCLVSNYWEDFANQLIRLSKDLGVTWIKWDAVGQYGCDAPNHNHGTANDTQAERAARYAYLQPYYFAKIIDKVCKANPKCTFEFDITEPGRCVGLQYLSSGKYYLMNNGPYYSTFGLPTPDKNANILVAPGAARGWFTRSVLDYDKWLPSILFMTHYQFDGDQTSQLINFASLILGQNGVWGELMDIPQENVSYIRGLMDKYKQVRNDITRGAITLTGENGGACEIYEKINPANGKGCISVFGNAPGEYVYLMKNHPDSKYWCTDGIKVKRLPTSDTQLTFTLKKASAAVIFFGIDK